MPQRQQVLLREKAPERQRRIQAGGGVTLGQHKAVPVRPVWILGIHVQFLAVQIGKQICGGQAPAGMAGLRGVGPLDHSHAHLTGRGHQLLLFVGCHSILLL